MKHHTYVTITLTFTLSNSPWIKWHNVNIEKPPPEATQIFTETCLKLEDLQMDWVCKSKIYFPDKLGIWQVWIPNKPESGKFYPNVNIKRGVRYKSGEFGIKVHWIVCSELNVAIMIIRLQIWSRKNKLLTASRISLVCSKQVVFVKSAELRVLLKHGIYS